MLIVELDAALSWSIHLAKKFVQECSGELSIHISEVVKLRKHNWNFKSLSEKTMKYDVAFQREKEEARRFVLSGLN